MDASAVPRACQLRMTLKQLMHEARADHVVRRVLVKDARADATLRALLLPPDIPVGRHSPEITAGAPRTRVAKDAEKFRQSPEFARWLAAHEAELIAEFVHSAGEGCSTANREPGGFCAAPNRVAAQARPGTPCVVVTPLQRSNAPDCPRPRCSHPTL